MMDYIILIVVGFIAGYLVRDYELYKEKQRAV